MIPCEDEEAKWVWVLGVLTTWHGGLSTVYTAGRCAGARKAAHGGCGYIRGRALGFLPPSSMLWSPLTPLGWSMW